MGRVGIRAPQYPEEASLIRNVLKFKKELLELDPWLPFPQRTGCYSFGPEGRPMPIGVLFILWEKWPEFTGKCLDCGGDAFGYQVGGYVMISGVMGCCSVCGIRFYGRNPEKDMLALLAQVRQIEPILEKTPYFVKGMKFGGSRGGHFGGRGAPLVKALQHLGAHYLPSDEWVLEMDSWSYPREIRSEGFSIDLSWFNEEVRYRIFIAICIGLVRAAFLNFGAFLSHLK